MKHLFAAVFLLTLLSMSACHTAEGFGKDLEEAGEELQEEADE